MVHSQNCGSVNSINLVIKLQVKPFNSQRSLAFRMLFQLHFLVHAFITSRLTATPSMQGSVSDNYLVCSLYRMPRLLTGTRKRDHITPVLSSLHWLPVQCRIDFKILLMDFKALHNMSPIYISNLLGFYTLVRTLRSSDQLLLALVQ